MSDRQKSDQAFWKLQAGDFGHEGSDLAFRWNANARRVLSLYDAEKRGFMDRMRKHPLTATVKPQQEAMIASEDPAEKLAILRDLVPIAEQCVSECLPTRVPCAACDGHGYVDGPPVFTGDAEVRP